MSTFAFFAQATNAAAAVAGAPATTAAQQQPMPLWANIVLYLPLVAIGYFLFIRPQSVAQKKQVEKLKGAKTGDKVVTTSGIHGVIANVKDGTFIVKIADNVKIELEKSHIDKVLKASAEPAAKA